MDIKVLLLTILIIGISIAAIAIKMFLKKGGEFKKQCSSKDGIGCICGNESECENDNVEKLT